MENIKIYSSKRTQQTSSAANYNRIFLTFLMLSFAVLLLLRDVGGISINKFLFVIITFVAVITLRMDNVIYLFCFINPLCVGLPSKYMIILFIFPFLLNFKNLRFGKNAFFSTMLVALWLFTQNFFFDTIIMESMIFPVELIFVALLFAYRNEVSTKRMAKFFIFGVAALGLIMLFSELQYFSLEELMDAGNRLGTTKDQYFGDVEMRVSVDPNYFGMFSITA